MATIKIRWNVSELANVLTQFDTQKVYRSSLISGPFTEITNPSTRVALVAGQTAYYYDDLTGTITDYYVITYYNSSTGHESNYSSVIRGSTPASPSAYADADLEARGNDIRAFLRDQPEFNILLDDIEFADEDIARAMRYATANYNAITPVTTLSTIQLNIWVLLLGSCCYLFRSEGARQLRNQVQAQDGNIAPVGIDEKQALYAQWADRMCMEFKELATKAKVQANMQSVYDSLSSGYRYVGQWITGSRSD